MHIFSGNPRKVIVSRDDVAAFNRAWPCSELRDTRAYWFEFDADGDLVDCDVPEHDDGQAAAAMADDCKAWLLDDEWPEWAADDSALTGEDFESNPAAYDEMAELVKPSDPLREI